MTMATAAAVTTTAPTITNKFNKNTNELVLMRKSIAAHFQSSIFNGPFQCKLIFQLRFKKKKLIKSYDFVYKLKRNQTKINKQNCVHDDRQSSFVAQLIPKRELNNTTDQTIQKVLFLVLSIQFSALIRSMI